MKIKIINEENIKDEELTTIVDRVKVFLINSQNEILMGIDHNTYQFIGGHREDGEDLNITCEREIEEETGIKLSCLNEPFFLRKHYIKDYPLLNDKSLYNYYYFVIKTDLKPNLNKTNYTEYEKEGKFRLEYVPIDKIETILQDNMFDNPRNHKITEENLEVIKIYKDIINY